MFLSRARCCRPSLLNRSKTLMVSFRAQSIRGPLPAPCEKSGTIQGLAARGESLRPPKRAEPARLLRCSSVKYGEHSPSSRLAAGPAAPISARSDSRHGLLAGAVDREAPAFVQIGFAHRAGIAAAAPIGGGQGAHLVRPGARAHR